MQIFGHGKGTKNHWQKKIEKKEGLQTLVSLGIPKYVPGIQDGF